MKANRTRIALVLVVGLVAGCGRPQAEEQEAGIALAVRQFREAARRHGLDVASVDGSVATHLEAMLGDRIHGVCPSERWFPEHGCVNRS